jgi:hypothetical protein
MLTPLPPTSHGKPPTIAPLPASGQGAPTIKPLAPGKPTTIKPLGVGGSATPSTPAIKPVPSAPLTPTLTPATPTITPPAAAVSQPASPVIAPPPATAAARPKPPPATPVTKGLSEEAKALKDEINRLHAAMENADHFAVLNLSPGASLTAIKDAYIKLAKKFHPDKIIGLGLADLADKAEEAFRRIKTAHETLTDPEKRKAYEHRLKTGMSEEEEKDAVRAVLEAEFAFQKGTVFFRKKNFKEALSEFKEAYKLNSEEGDHLAWIAWTVFCDPRTNRKQMMPKIKQQLLESIKISPNSPTCHYFLGEVYLALEEPKRAVTCFNKVLELNPNHVDAQRQLRLMNMRRERSDKKKGGSFLDRFRKK